MPKEKRKKQEEKGTLLSFPCCRFIVYVLLKVNLSRRWFSMYPYASMVTRNFLSGMLFMLVLSGTAERKRREQQVEAPTAPPPAAYPPPYGVPPHVSLFTLSKIW